MSELLISPNNLRIGAAVAGYSSINDVLYIDSLGNLADTFHVDAANFRLCGGDGSSDLSVDWNARQLTTNSGAFISYDYANGAVNNPFNGITVLSTPEGFLNDPNSGNTIFDIPNGLLNAGGGGGLAIDLINRVLKDSLGNTLIDFQNCAFYAPGGGGGIALAFDVAAKTYIYQTVTSYNGLSTGGTMGMPAIYATTSRQNQSAALGSTLLYAVPASKSSLYRINFVANIKTAASVSSVLGGANGFQVSYTDQDDSAIKTTPIGITASTNSTGTQINGVIIVSALASTNINFTFGYTSSGLTAMVYNLRVYLEQI